MQTIESYLAEHKAEMMAAEVLSLYAYLRMNGVRLHIDGGWSVDALLGEQTRPHEDLDIAVQHKDVSKLRGLLLARGYQEILRDDTWEANFVLADAEGHMLDVHSYTFEKGKPVFGCAYPPDSLTGRGVIAGVMVDCIAPAWLVKFHTGYALDENDYRDVSALCKKFGLELPADYTAFLESGLPG